jgi:hypothetical protein
LNDRSVNRRGSCVSGCPLVSIDLVPSFGRRAGGIRSATDARTCMTHEQIRLDISAGTATPKHERAGRRVGIGG